MYGIDEDEFLTHGIAIATRNGSGNKRKRDENEVLNHSDSKGSCQDQEGGLFDLLQMREQMLKKKAHPTHHEDGGSKGLHLIHLLLMSATSVSKNRTDSAIKNLLELYQNGSFTGDSIQRVVSYFTDGLFAKLLTQESPLYDTVMKNPTPDEEFLAFTALYKVSPFFQFAHFTANQAILEAFEKEEDTNTRVLHVIDFDVSYGFQWPSLMQSLSEKATIAHRVSLKITGFGRNLEELQETESRLVSFAKIFRNLVFEFHGLVRGSRMVKFKGRENETVAVNLVFNLKSSHNFSTLSEKLRFVRSINPSIVVLVEQEGGSVDNNKFLPRFLESLHYFAAMFESLDDSLPVDSAERLIIEKNHFGKEIKSAINYHEENDSCPIFDNMETWKARMGNLGFLGLKLSSKSVMQAKLLLKIRSHCPNVDSDNGGFRVFERDDGKAISLGWQQRSLITASSWCCNDVR